ncbi:MAG: hypothetical protein FJZ56_02830 [Chlamydiae bacterium]|nr:hypothetical protein [Chlamydiota bacterium]
MNNIIGNSVGYVAKAHGAACNFVTCNPARGMEFVKASPQSATIMFVNNVDYQTAKQIKHVEGPIKEPFNSSMKRVRDIIIEALPNR